MVRDSSSLGLESAVVEAAHDDCLHIRCFEEETRASTMAYKEDLDDHSRLEACEVEAQQREACCHKENRDALAVAAEALVARVEAFGNGFRSR